MRQIKFRVWDKKYKQYIICGYPYGGDAVYSMNPFSGKFQILNASYDYDSGVDIQAKEPDIILEQFTGLLDCTGKEIYEGDKLEHCFETKINIERNEKVKSPGYARIVIGFEHGCYTYSIVEQENYYFAELPSRPRPIWTIDFSLYKVIGHIHEEGKTK